MKKLFNKKILIITLIIVIFIPITSFALSIIIYDSVFNVKYAPKEPMSFTLEEFEGLDRKKFVYDNYNNDKLCGYLYFNDEIKKNEIDNINGLVIFVHGLGSGGHNIYLEAINFFVNKNFYVFSYDASGNNESDGIINGLPQQLADLHCTIKFIKENINIINDLPLFLIGHSWGGYAVSNILNYIDDIEAVVSIAGFNSSRDIILYYGKKYASIFAYFGLPFVIAREKLKFGVFGKSDALTGFYRSNANVMIIHSKDDNIVSMDIGYTLYYDKFKNEDRFEFILYEDRGHSYVMYSDNAIREINNFNNKFNEWLKTLDYNYKNKKNIKRFINDKKEYYKDHLDRNIVCNLIDKDLFNKIVEFYMQSL